MRRRPVLHYALKGAFIYLRPESPSALFLSIEQWHPEDTSDEVSVWFGIAAPPDRAKVIALLDAFRALIVGQTDHCIRAPEGRFKEIVIVATT